MVFRDGLHNPRQTASLCLNAHMVKLEINSSPISCSLAHLVQFWGPFLPFRRTHGRSPSSIRLRTIHKLDSANITSSWRVFLA
jgi:hypothetical protein